MPPGPTLDAAGTLGVRKRPAGVVATMQYQVAFGTQCHSASVKGGIASLPAGVLPPRCASFQLPGSA